MKTLKKTLCLVLAVVLAVGVLVIPANADKATWDGFTDKKTVDIKYQEAVGALTGLGAINGKGNNEVQADKYVTRAEAVTMLVSAALGQDAVKVLPVRDTKFADVTKAHFAAKFVDYAVQEGIVAGKTDTAFVPNDVVTGYELAKMALVAAEIVTVFDPSNWQITTAVEAQKAGLLIGLENITDLNKPLTRQEAAQLLWNMVTYLPESVTLDVLTVENNDTTLTYKVTFPEESIGGAVYNLAAVYNYDKDDKPGDASKTWDEDYGYPSVKWYNDETEEVYYAGAVSGLVNFTFGDGAADKLTIADLKKALNIKADGGIDAAVYIDGFNSTPNVLHAADPETTPVTGNDSDRGASVVIFKAPAWYASVKYFVYVNYIYAAYANTASDDFVVTEATSGEYVDNTSIGKVAAKTVATFGVSQYKDKAVNVITNGRTYEGAQITRRSNDSTQPYFYLNNSTTKTYISAKAIYVSADGSQVLPLIFQPEAGHTDAKNYITVDATRYYDVWLDDAGNVLVLKETVKPAAPGEKLQYNGFGYVLEFSSKAGTSKDDMQWTSGTDAQAKILMVDVKTGTTAIYNLAVEKVDGAWMTKGVDAKTTSGIEIKETQECIGPASEPHGTQAIIHGFVAYKNLGKGGWAVTPIYQLDSLEDDLDQNYAVVTSFTATNKAGQVLITEVSGDTMYLYGNGKTSVTLLNTPTFTADKSRVDKYTVDAKTGYAHLKNIKTYTTVDYPGEKTSTGTPEHDAHVGVNALFKYDANNQIVAAYVFGERIPETQAPSAKNYYVFMYREDSKQGSGTDFHFLVNGEEKIIHATEEAVKDMKWQLDNSVDRMTVCEVELKDGNLKNVTKIEDTNFFDEGLAAYSYHHDKDGDYFGIFAWDDGNEMKYITENCWVFDMTNTDYTDVAGHVKTTVPVGATVTIYYDYSKADPDTVERVALVVITAQPTA